MDFRDEDGWDQIGAVVEYGLESWVVKEAISLGNVYEG